MKRKDNNMKKAFVFDFDDTLATTDCRVLVRSTQPAAMNRVVKTLTPAEFNDYDLREGTEFDFSEFRSEKFIHNAIPTSLINLAKEVYDEDHSVYVLTARADNVAEAISDWLCGFDVRPVRVFGVGRDDKKVDIAAEKKKVLGTLAQAFDLVYFYDDSEENCDLARGVGNGVKVYLV
jgi:phosphoserine phosphatase